VKLEAGSRVGHYEVVAAIAVGGMGEVYRARDPRLDRDVALKLLPSGLASADALRRFEQEARAASALNHPNIVTIYEIGRVDSMPYIAMELIDGVSLRQELRKGRLVLKEAMRIASKMADGLAAAHEKGIVHRDLKPENVMISTEGFVKILDFGLAKLEKAPKEGDATDLQTAPGVVYGTAGYMSPEQARAAPIDFRSDQFSFGAIVYEMVTGLRAFRRETNLDTLAAIVRDDPDPISRVNPEVPTEIQIIVERCLAKEPRERYGSTRDLARDLRDSRNRLTQQTTLPLLGKRGRWFPSRKAVGAVALSLAIVVVIVVGASKTRVEQPRPHRPSIPQEKHLAVLPFTEVSGRPDAQMFSEGISQTVSARLSRSPDVQVVSIGALGKSAGSVDVQRIAHGVGANLVLQGTVQRVSDQIRIIYTLVLVDGGVQIAGDTVTGPSDDVFAIEDRLADIVVAALALRSPVQAAASRGRTGLESPSDQDSYLEALGLLQRPNVTTIDVAIDKLQNLSPAARNSALVNAQLGAAYLSKYVMLHNPALIRKASFFCNRAIAADANVAEAHTTLGELLKINGDHASAINEFQTALSEQPNNDKAMTGLAEAYELAGRLQDAERTYQRAIDVNPLYAARTNSRAYQKLGAFYFGHRQYDRAATMFRRMTEIAPDDPRGFNNLGGALEAQGRYDDAMQAYKHSLALGPTSLAWSNLATCDYFLGHYAEAAAAAEKATKLAPDYWLLWANLGDAYRWMPDSKSKALNAYQNAIRLGRQELTFNAKDVALCATIAACYAKSGQLTEARSFLARAIALKPTDPPTMYQAAVIDCVSGNYREAAQWLQRSIAAGYGEADAQRDPEFQMLRNSPEFRAALIPNAPKT
jgi:serine/threonine protein kinase/tetratricopeptide (TPR) repeat protein